MKYFSIVTGARLLAVVALRLRRMPTAMPAAVILVPLNAARPRAAVRAGTEPRRDPEGRRRFARERRVFGRLLFLFGFRLFHGSSQQARELRASPQSPRLGGGRVRRVAVAEVLAQRRLLLRRTRLEFALAVELRLRQRRLGVDDRPLLRQFSLDGGLFFRLGIRLVLRRILLLLDLPRLGIQVRQERPSPFQLLVSLRLFVLLDALVLASSIDFVLLPQLLLLDQIHFRLLHRIFGVLGGSFLPSLLRVPRGLGVRARLGLGLFRTERGLRARLGARRREVHVWSLLLLVAAVVHFGAAHSCCFNDVAAAERNRAARASTRARDRVAASSCTGFARRRSARCLHGGRRAAAAPLGSRGAHAVPTIRGARRASATTTSEGTAQHTALAPSRPDDRRSSRTPVGGRQGRRRG